MAFALFDKVRIDGKGVNGSIVDIYTPKPTMGIILCMTARRIG